MLYSAKGERVLFFGVDPTTMLFLTAAFVIAISTHEANHAFVATALGDDTPRLHGRLTLNPLRHIDLTGLIFFVVAGVGWGWTPVSPGKLRPNPRTGSALVASAGPLANLAVATAASLPLRIGLVTDPLIRQFLFLVVFLNLLLFVLNLIPLPPLDGFSVVLGLAPDRLAALIRPLERAGLGVLLIVLVLLPSVFGVNILTMLFTPVTQVFGLESLR
ncbi:MAG: site-2 protease family protein [Chloroflexi bacterium]|nr:site-2 protease family protein [Chloroflexota bacterium]